MDYKNIKSDTEINYDVVDKLVCDGNCEACESSAGCEVFNREDKEDEA